MRLKVIQKMLIAVQYKGECRLKTCEHDIRKGDFLLSYLKPFNTDMPTLSKVTKISRDLHMLKQRMHGPDVLRGIAATGVVFFHVLYLSGLPINETASSIVGRFDFFVRIFFILSAFAIANAYARNITDLDSIKRFYLKRFFRIAPLFYFMLAIGVLYSKSTGQPWPSSFEFLASVSFLFQLIPGSNGLVGGGWSISIEWLFYALFPLFVSLIAGWRSALLSWMLLTSIAVLGRDHFTFFLNGELRVFGLLYILSHAQYFVLGLLLYFLTQRYPLLVNNEKYKNICGIAFCCTLAAIVITFKLNQRIPEEIFLSIFGFFLVLLSVIGLPRILDNSASRWLGLISYSIYLVQFPIIQALREHGTYNYVNLLVGGGISAFILNSMLTICLVIGVSTATYFAIELPGQRLLTNLIALKKKCNANK